MTINLCKILYEYMCCISGVHSAEMYFGFDDILAHKVLNLL